jgi:3-hydroxyacyl-[acyl-carrier-protein] dehydratase
VDRVLDWESGKTITAIKNVTVNEEFFNGHFPHKPVMPGVLMIEALAQTAALLSFLTDGRSPMRTRWCTSSASTTRASSVRWNRATS